MKKREKNYYISSPTIQYVEHLPASSVTVLPLLLLFTSCLFLKICFSFVIIIDALNMWQHKSVFLVLLTQSYVKLFCLAFVLPNGS